MLASATCQDLQHLSLTSNSGKSHQMAAKSFLVCSFPVTAACYGCSVQPQFQVLQSIQRHLSLLRKYLPLSQKEVYDLHLMPPRRLGFKGCFPIFLQIPYFSSELLLFIACQHQHIYILMALFLRYAVSCKWNVRQLT